MDTLLTALYPQGDPATRVLLAHSRRVRDKALAVADRLHNAGIDRAFVAQAAMLHDIGILRTRAPGIGCHGQEPYIRHGILGRMILEKHGWPRHGLVCERHVGVGISVDDILAQNLPLPFRDMRPVTLEETIICYADNFFSKSNGGRELTVDAIVKDLERHGKDKPRQFLTWHNQFGI